MGSLQTRERNSHSHMHIDLTHPLGNGMPVYPGTLEPDFRPNNTVATNGFAELKMTMCSHTGTHIDAPCHVFEGGRSLDEFSIDRFMGPACLIEAPDDAALTLGNLESLAPQIARSRFVIFRTGWHRKWNSPAYFEGFPTLSPEAAEWLASLELCAVGIDAASIDKVADSHLPNHHILLAKEVLIIENLAHLDRLGERDFPFACIPLKVAQADGCPVRAFAGKSS